MQKQPQSRPQRSNWKHTLIAWIRGIVIASVLIAIIVGTVIWIMQGAQAIVPVAILTSLGLLFGFIQLFPILFPTNTDKQPEVVTTISQPEPIVPTLPPSQALQVLPPPEALVSKMDRGDAPDIHFLYGREKDLSTLKQWIVNDDCRVVAIVGAGGIGKTSLSIKLMDEVKDAFTYVFWRSLQNAPPLKAVLEDCIHFISNQKQTPETIDEQFSLLQVYLRTYRCLLMLDNVESILGPGEHAGKYRQGYEDYGRLLEAVGEIQHTSCLVLTSREKPGEVARFEGRNAPVRSLQLSGLERLDGQELLRDKDLFGSDESWAALVQLYSGNPLYLQVASEPIQTIFGGDIKRFLKNGGSVFGDLRDPLDLQFTRLSAFEQEIMYWLAIEREALSLENLRADIVRFVSKGTLLEGLNSLRRRSIIEYIGVARFTLQPVIMQYVLDRFIEQIVGETIEGKLEFFARYFLMKAQGKDYVRNSQLNLIVLPIIERLRAMLGQKEAEKRLKSQLTILHEMHVQKPGYAGGNLLNLLINVQADLRGSDFTSLVVWEAYLQGATLPEVNFAYADLARSVFTETFGSVITLAFSPDGGLLAAGTTNGEVRLWRFPNATPHRTFQGHTDWVRSMAFSADGRLLATGSGDQSIKVWDVDTGACLAILHGHTNWVRSVVFTANAALLVSGSEDQTIRIWDVNTGTCLNILHGHTERVYAVACSPDGKVIASGSHDQTIRLWDISTGECTQVLKGYSKGVSCLAFRSDHELVSGGGDQTVRLWDVRTGDCVRVLHEHTGWIWALAISADGSMIVSGSEDQTVRIWDALTGTCLKILQGHQKIINSIAFNHDGSVIASGSEDQTVRAWEVTTGQCIHVLQGYSNPIWFVAFSADGRTIASGSEDQIVRVWEVDSRKCIRTLRGHKERVYAVGSSRDGRLLASGSEDCTIRIWDVESGQCSRVLTGHNERIYSVSFSPDSKLLASASHDQTIRVWDPITGECVAQFQKDNFPMCCVAFSPKGSMIASGCYDKSVQLWDCESGQCIRELKGHTSPVWSLAFSADGALLVSASHDHTLRVWDVQSGDCVSWLQGHSSWVGSATMSAAGDLVASGSGDQTVRIWNVLTEQCMHILRGHTSWVWTVSFSQDGKVLASGSEDGTLRLWDVQTGKQMAVLRNERPYEQMNITGVSGLTEAQKTSLKSLGAIELSPSQ